MLRLSKKVEYGLIAILHMDEQAPGEVVSAKEMAERYHLPVDLFGKVLQALARAGVVESVHGAHGGYCLQRAFEELTLGDVMEAIEGPLQLVRCQEHPDTCDQFTVCTIREPVLAVQQRLIAYMGAFRLTDFRTANGRSLQPRE